MSTRIQTFSRRAASHDPRVLRWRRDQLRAAGFPDVLAEEAPRDQRLDLHAMIELVERGCEPALAVRILAPIDEPRDVPCSRRAGFERASPGHGRDGGDS